MIPRIIHQTWKNEDIPDKFVRFQNSWIQHHPNWQYILWTDTDLRNLIQVEYPWFLNTYDNYKYHIQRVDAARYFILHKYGGLYVDLDFECRKNFNKLVTDYFAVFGNEPTVHAQMVYKRNSVVSNAIMASSQGHPIWEAVFSELLKRSQRYKSTSRQTSGSANNVLWTTGPGMLDDVLRNNKKLFSKNELLIAPPDWFFPILAPQFKGRQHAIRFPSYAVHHWANTWISAKNTKTNRQ